MSLFARYLAAWLARKTAGESEAVLKYSPAAHLIVLHIPWMKAGSRYQPLAR